MSLIIWIIGLLLVAAVVYYFILSSKEKNKSENKEMQDLSEATIRDAMKGDFVIVAGLSDDFEDLNFEIVERNRYESVSGSWYELKGVHGNKTVWLEWEDDDELIITATPSRQSIRISEIGLSEDELIRLDEEGQADDSSIEWKGKRYYFDFSGEVGFFKNDSDEGEGFYLWEFVSDDDTEQLAVEKWEGESFEVFHTRIIPPFNVTVLKKS